MCFNKCFNNKEKYLNKINVIFKMQKKGGVRIFLILILLNTLLVSLVVSSFSVKDFLEETSQGIVDITGYATTGVSGVNLSLAGRNGDIYYIENVTTQSINENTFLNLSISFYLSDPDGNSVNPDQARMNLTK